MGETLVLFLGGYLSVMNENQISQFTMFFNRLPGLWWLCGETLKHWVTHRDLKFFKEPGISVTCSRNTLEDYCQGRGGMLHWNNDVLQLGGMKIWILFNQKTDGDIVATEEEKEKLKRRQAMWNNGLWRFNLDPAQPYTVQVPFRFGTVLDKWKPLWWKDNEHGILIHPNTWFTPERKHNGYELLSIMLDCGERAGIRDSMWLGFGNMFGYVVCGDFLPHDTDLDLCIDQETSTYEGDMKYLEEIQKPFKIGNQNFPHGLTEKMYRFSNKRDDTNRPLWISIGHRSIENDNGVKSCNWWFFKHSNYYWHSKGDRWVQPGKFSNEQINRTEKAIALGQPAGMLDEFIEVDFNGVAVNMPVKAGTCLDWWYPGWKPGLPGSSAKKVLLAIPNWNKKVGWRILK
jgi:hypothetical protein